jgi:hypothetical protein
MPIKYRQLCEDTTMKRDDRRAERLAFLLFLATDGAMLAKALFAPCIQ